LEEDAVEIVDDPADDDAADDDIVLDRESDDTALSVADLDTDQPKEI
jgi:hypothetical protein